MASAIRNNSPETLAERFWSVARGLDGEGPGVVDPIAVVKHVLRVLDVFDSGAVGDGVTVNTRSFLLLLRQQELEGDLLYASPEQARGEQVDERSLVFSVGVLLFEKLTGRHPFGAADNPRRVARIQKGEMGSGVNFFPTVPAGLRLVLMRAMGPFPEERWENLAALRAKLIEFLDDAGAPRLPGIAGSGSAPPVVRTRPETARDDEPTRIVARPHHQAVAASGVHPAAHPAIRPIGTPAGGVPLAKVLVAPVAATATHAPAPALAPVIVTVNAERRRGSRAPLLYMVLGSVLGAALASAAFVVLAPGRSSAPTTVAAAAEVGSTGEPAAQLATPARPVARPVAAQDPMPAPTLEVAPTPAPAVFDPEAAGEQVLAASRSCFTPARLSGGIMFGAGLLFPKTEPLARKVYFASGDGLSVAEHRCLDAAFVGSVSSRAAPPKNTIVEFTVRLRGDSGTIKARAVP